MMQNVFCSRRTPRCGRWAGPPAPPTATHAVAPQSEDQLPKGGLRCRCRCSSQSADRRLTRMAGGRPGASVQQDGVVIAGHPDTCSDSDEGGGDAVHAPLAAATALVGHEMAHGAEQSRNCSAATSPLCGRPHRPASRHFLASLNAARFSAPKVVAPPACRARSAAAAAKLARRAWYTGGESLAIDGTSVATLTY